MHPFDRRPGAGAPLTDGDPARLPDPAPVIAIAGAEKVFPNGTRALAPVDLEVQDGAFVTLLGPSGCGKTTLLTLIAGLAAPSAGTIRWWGGDFAGTGGPGRRFGFVFQAPTLMPWARVRTNVRLPLDLLGVPRAAARRDAADALAQVGLTDFADHLPRELSGGMQMRVSIARAIATAPDLLLMDEPFGALDEFTRQRLDGELATLWAARGLTVVFVTHSIYEAVFLSTRVAVMGPRPGRIIADVAIDEPFPRTDAFRVSTAFARYCQQLWALVTAASSAHALHA
ncbi:MAG: ABC transporter ATP-binding protein [Casimicrobiaceae bacterium]